MIKFILTLFTFLSLYQPAFAVNSGKFFVAHTDSREEINYNINVNPDFKNNFISSLKTGNIVTVEHIVKIRPVSQWLGWLAEKRYVKYYKYNLMNGQYYIGVKKDRLIPIDSIETAINDLGVLKNTPFLPKNVLQKNHAYVIDFKITINPVDESMLNSILPFSHKLLQESIHGAVHYIDK